MKFRKFTTGKAISIAINNQLSMSRCLDKLSRLIGYFLMISLVAGCADSGSEILDEYLIRIGDREVSVLEFHEAFEIVKTAYPHNIRHNHEDLKKAQLRLLNQMTVEMILLERAEELAIEVSEAEVERAIAEIKGDYPEGVFEETLIEFAVSYESWENRLRTRLILERVIDKELKEQIVITPEDIARYYEENLKGQNLDPDPAKWSENINEAIIADVRRKKAEEVYESWINDLKSNYRIEINTAQWEKITEAKSLPEKNSELGESEDN